jgi:ketosteroid isomerase-like protein
MPDNVELARRANAAFNARDLDGFMEVLAADAELSDLANAPDQQSTIKGREAILAAWALWEDAFEDLRAEIEEYTALGDFVICDAHWVGRGKGSGISIDVRQFDVFEYRDGKCVSAILGLKSRQEARKAVRERTAAG